MVAVTDLDPAAGPVEQPSIEQETQPEDNNE
jgi:hypothetical protein